MANKKNDNIKKTNDIVVKLPKPLPYQKDVINWARDKDTKYISFLKSRQSGGSFTNKLLVSMWALENNNAKIGYITPTLKLSKLFFSELVGSLKLFINNSNGTDLIINFISGSKLQFFSAESKDSIRGFQFSHCILDEAAFMSDDIWNYVIKPTTMIIGKKVVMTSTPNGAQGFFYQYCTYGFNNELGYKTKHINIYDNPFITKDEIEKIKSQIPVRIFLQEYMAQFTDGAGAVFTSYNKCIIKNPVKTAKVYAAIDWAKTEDYTVLTILNDKAQVLYRYRINGMDYTQQVRLIAGKLNEWKPAMTISEENNIGQVVNELLKKAYKGALRCITLDNDFKREIIEDLIVAFEQGTIGIDDDEVLLRELQSFTCTYNPQTQKIKYAARTGLHDDCVISLAYAYHLAKNKNNNYNIAFI